MLELDQSPHFDWAHDAFVALNDNGPIHPSTEKWHPFASSADSMNNLAFTIPPSLLTQGSVEQRFGQITPPEDLSPAAAELRRDSARDSSIPADQVRNEALWPEHQVHALQDYNRRHAQDAKQQQQTEEQKQAEEPVQSQSQSQSHQLDSPELPSPKRRRSGRQASANHSQPSTTAPPQPQQNANPQPPKRKRGRPKSQPQMVEAYSTEGYPFQVSSARQSHLEKNRVAAHKCRQRKKEYINGLEGRAREYSSKNKALKENVAMLREEVLELKNEVLRHAGCGFWAVDEYLARCAGDLLGMSPSLGIPGPRKATETQSPTLSTIQTQQTKHRESTAESLPSEITDLTNDHDDDFGGLELLQDFDDDMEDA